jgi:hypothetical protein
VKPVQCPWKIHWAKGQEHTTQCERNTHTDPNHRGNHPNPRAPGGATIIAWVAGDRREYTGGWPGPCVLTRGCVLHTGHVGRCAT